MAAAKYTEDTLVQQTTAEFLKDELGWESVYAYDQEDYGPASLLGRADQREVVLTRDLRAALERINPGLPATAYDDVVKAFAGATAGQSPLATNREKYDLLRDGAEVTYRDARGERLTKRLRAIDFDEPANNRWLCVRELWVKGDLYRRRADILLFVNGLPLVFVECKGIHKNLKTAFEKNYRDYRDTIPHLFHHNAIVMFGNGVDGRIGSLTSRWEHFQEWKRLAEGDAGIVDMETMLRGVCSKKNLLDLVENFVLFDESAGKTVKIVARNHQYLGVNRAVEAVRERKARDGKLGVFWHTQGSGKSYSMTLFTRKVHRKLGGNFTFVVLTDRDDLDTQIYKTFVGCGVVDKNERCRASSGPHLEQLLGQHKSYVFALIQKFNREVPTGKPYTDRDDVIVISDEAHRSQYGTLSLNMRNALPGASYIGFTGTPLFTGDEITRRVFGEYVSKYDFQRAVEDGATVPLYYDARGDKLGLSVGDLNERIAAKLEELEIEGVEVEERLERELKRDYHVVTADKRLEQVARDFVRHYSTAWESGKAMLVCLDKLVCVKMHGLIKRFWQERIAELEQAEAREADEQEAVMIARQIAWMRETVAAVVVSEEQGEVDKFRKHGLDILPHRRLIKQGIDLPAAMREKDEYRNLQTMTLEDAFKAPEHPFRIAVVCAMWLTGFDVPSLGTLYLDKPLKAHTLMQAIARANRVFEDKNNGLIVDYCGIVKHLRKALATFAGTGIGDGETNEQLDPTRPEEELLAEVDEAIAIVRDYLTTQGASLDAVLGETGFALNAAIVACKEAVNESGETRKRFGVMAREVFKKFKACINLPAINERRHDRDAINIVYKSLERDREEADISAIIRELHAVVDGVVTTRPDAAGEPSQLYDMSKIDFERLRQEFARSNKQRTVVMSLMQAIDARVQRLIQQNPLRTDFQLHYEEIVDEYNREKDRATVERTFEALLRLEQGLEDEQRRAVREGLDEESLAIFDLLRKPELTPEAIRKIKAVAASLLEKVKAEISRLDHWQDKDATRSAVQTLIHDFLFRDDTGLPEDAYNADEVDAATEQVYRHIFRAYPTIPSPIYAGMGAA